MNVNTLIKREYDYAVRICAYLAGQKRNKAIPISRIAELLSITKPFANKIIFQLRKAGIIDSVQGRYGGIYLKRNPKELSVLDILNAMEFNSIINECLRTPGICPIIGFCKIHIFFSELQEILIKRLKEKMISDLVIHDYELESIVF
ncbi:RrF2 family transcriptional regulator [Caldithrix abyssi]|uniref:Rrf2 family protein n=1 Tax=Caldithrix abyssi DSM 13497 TaxID=880073 RepID=H1XPK9_CALAY|nr:Rrf2 family transcriptional regulator [Caldithrix abyssi]APF19834.1 Rrf2 family protein [Caldithrix abyssi DSM 13497]EHO39930.1 transcriptional regulator, BadM/Rrf2 family [Caldithrix abyssi DSM 13497]